jgi:hypothetical protein
MGVLDRMKMTRLWTFTFIFIFLGVSVDDLYSQLPDLSSVTPDLVVPELTSGEAAPGKRVKGVLPPYEGTEIYHALYLPTDWKPNAKWPIIIEISGNGPYTNKYGDWSSGKVEGSSMGYGLSAGKGFLWFCSPYIDPIGKTNVSYWWGDPNATTAYMQKAVAYLEKNFGGDASKVVLVGFSKGAIGVSYLGLRDEATASLWKGLLAHDHFDGLRSWPYPESETNVAVARLTRLGNIALCASGSTAKSVQSFFDLNHLKGNVTYISPAFRNHNDQWTLRDIPARVQARAWLSNVIGN